jgi:hypothetical protein
VHRVGSQRPVLGGYARLPGMAPARRSRARRPLSASRHRRSGRSERLAGRPRLRLLRLWRWRRWLEQWPLRPSPPGLDHTALSKGPGQPISRAPEARPLLLPAPPQLWRQGSEVKMLKASSGCPTQGTLSRSHVDLPPPERCCRRLRVGFPLCFIATNHFTTRNAHVDRGRSRTSSGPRRHQLAVCIWTFAAMKRMSLRYLSE